VAGRAPRDAMTGQPGFLGQTQLLIFGSGGDDDRGSPISGPAVGGDLLEVTVQIEALGVVVFDDGTKVCGLLGQGDHQVWALDVACKPVDVIDVGSTHERTVMAHGFGNVLGRDACPASLDYRSVAGCAGPYDEQLVSGLSELSGGGHLRLSPVLLAMLG